MATKKQSRLAFRNPIPHLDGDALAALAVEVGVVRHTQSLAVLKRQRHQARRGRLFCCHNKKRKTRGSENKRTEEDDERVNVDCKSTVEAATACKKSC